MRPPLWSCGALVDALLVPGEPEVAGELVVVAEPEAGLSPERLAGAVDRLAGLPCVVMAAPGSGRHEHALALVDAVAAGADDLDAMTDTFARAPIAAASLALHLRASERRNVPDGLVAESALYSTLQGGPEHRAWRAATPVRERPGDGIRVRVERVADQLHINLARPAVRNALDAAMRDDLLAALAVAEADPELRVVLRGDGPTFCSGGDLDEFGSAPDPATAHVIRLQRSVGAVLHRLADRTTVHLHGPCAGSGVELAAFAARVVATPDTTVTLPELRLGLIPGAGGTVSLPARIGRHRTAWLALTAVPIDAERALDWGLVDEIILI